VLRRRLPRLERSALAHPETIPISNNVWTWSCTGDTDGCWNSSARFWVRKTRTTLSSSVIVSTRDEKACLIVLPCAAHQRSLWEALPGFQALAVNCLSCSVCTSFCTSIQLSTYHAWEQTGIRQPEGMQFSRCRAQCSSVRCKHVFASPFYPLPK